MFAAKEVALTLQISILEEAQEQYVQWQGKLNAAIALFPGFISLEILAAGESPGAQWVIVQRFNTLENLKAWQDSSKRKQLLEDLTPMLSKASEEKISDISKDSWEAGSGVTEVFVTQVSPENEKAFKKWLAKIHQAEAKYPGFRGMYVQSPLPSQGTNWITMLQFDSVDNLDNWISSAERKAILEESKPLICSIESHRVVSPYAGWFGSLSHDKAQVPSVWKQSMLVLLVLFPIVMLEIKFLNPLLTSLNPSLATFIGNAISVTLVTYPLIPFALKYLRWWFTPVPNTAREDSIKGSLIVIGLYIIEIAVLWKLV